jgi:hypothetical protein
LGPKIQGGADGEPAKLVPFSLPGWPHQNRITPGVTFDALAAFLDFTQIEGIVWHHEDGRKAKIKRRDFGLRWPLPKC